MPQTPPLVRASTRWDRWQQTPVIQRFIPLRDRLDGYTVVRIAWAYRDLFLDVVRLLNALSRLGNQAQTLMPWIERWHQATIQLAEQAEACRREQTPHK